VLFSEWFLDEHCFTAVPADDNVVEVALLSKVERERRY
jgi:hypothetical protein